MSGQLAMFPEPAPAAQARAAGMLRRTAILRTDRDGRDYRLLLTRSWGAGPFVLWKARNPSTANHLREDPSLHRMMHFTRSWGFNRMAVVNEYIIQSPDQALLYGWLRSIGPDERRQQREIAWGIINRLAKRAGLIVTASGKTGAPDDKWPRASDDRLIHLGDILGIPVCHIGLNLDGSPKHPMARGKHRVPDDQQPIRWTA